MKKIKIKLTKYEAETLEYYVEKLFLVVLGGSQLRAMKRVREKLEKEIKK